MVIPNTTAFDALAAIAGNGSTSIFGTQQIVAFILLAAVIAALSFIGLDIVVGVSLAGLVALGFGFLGWLPMQETLVVVLIIWGLGFAYFITMFHGTR